MLPWLLHLLSVPGRGEDQVLKGLYLLTTCVTLSEFWNCFDLSFFTGKLGTMLAPFLIESSYENMKASEKVWHKWQLISQMTLSQPGCYMWFLSIQWPGVTICYFAFQVHYCCVSSVDRPYRCPSSLHHTITSMFYYTLCPGATFPLSWPLKASLINHSCLFLSGLSIYLTAAFQATCASWLELAHEIISICFSSHEQFPKVEIQWIKLEYRWSSCASSLYKWPQ